MVYSSRVWSFYSNKPNDYYPRFLGDVVLYIGCTPCYYMIPNTDHIYTEQRGWIVSGAAVTREELMCALREKCETVDLHVSRFHGVLEDEIKNAQKRQGSLFECGAYDMAAATEFCFSEQKAVADPAKSYVTISNPNMKL